MRTLLLAAALALALVTPGRAQVTTNPNIPAQGSPLNSGPVRANFGAAYTDLTNLMTMFVGTACPVSPLQGQDCLNTSTVPATWSKYTPAGWAEIGTINLSTATFTALTNAPGGSTGQVQYNNAGVFGGFTFGGDCTLTIPNITCTKTSGTAFVASATTDTTNASNISTGTLAGARMAAANLAASGNGGVTGNLPVTNLNGGTGASSSTAWCGNGTWCTPASGSLILLNTLTAIASSTVTFTNGQPTVGLTNTFIAGQCVQFTTTGTLPTNFSTATNYYVIATGLTTSQFEVSATFGGSAISAGSAGTGTQSTAMCSLIDNSSMTSTYTTYEVELVNVNPGTASTGCQLQVISAGALEATSYLGQIVQATGTGAAGVAYTTFIPCSYSAGGSGMTTVANLGATLTVATPSGTAGNKQWWGHFVHQITGPATIVATAGGAWNSSAAITGVAVSPSSGVWAANSIMKIYGKL